MLQKFNFLKRIFVTAILIIGCFLLESTVFQRISLISVTPNLLIVITSAFGFMRGKKDGMLVGFFSGLLLDVFFGDLIGFYAMIYMILGYCNGFFKRIFYDDDIKLPIALIAASDFIYGNVVCLFMFVIRSRFHYFYYFRHVILPELIYTTVVTVVLYQIVLKINQRLEAQEKRSASKFV